MVQQMETFKTNLEDYAMKHKNEIKKNPQFRRQFQEMCASIGVDPLASGKGKIMSSTTILITSFMGSASETLPYQLKDNKRFQLSVLFNNL